MDRSKRGKYKKEVKPRNLYITENRQMIIDFCKGNNGNITKAQTMNLLKNGKCSPDLAYSVLKSMVDAKILEKYGKCKFKLTEKFKTNEK